MSIHGKKDCWNGCKITIHTLVIAKWSWNMFEIWDGDLYLYSVDTRYEADEQQEAGFTIKSLEYYGA